MLVGRSAKENPDRARVVVDFLDWLDPGEGVSATTTPAITVDVAGSWSCSNPGSGPAPADTTPLALVSLTMMDATTKAVLLLDAGTPGLVYLISFVATGGTSGRKQAIEIRMTVMAAP